MTIKVLKTVGNKDTYFFNKTNGDIQEKYEKSDDLILVTKMEDGSIIEIPNSMIKEVYGGQLIFEYDDNTKYIIDDGYQDLLIRSGYIVLNNYDTENIEDKDFGYQTRVSLMETIKTTFQQMLKDRKMEYKTKCSNQSVRIEFDISGYHYSVGIDTVNNIVNKNMQRKINDLPFYPFIKEMDKYGTMYFTIFCKKCTDNDPEDFNMYNTAENMIILLMNYLNQLKDNNRYRFQRIIIKKRINNFEGI